MSEPANHLSEAPKTFHATDALFDKLHDETAQSKLLQEPIPTAMTTENNGDVVTGMIAEASSKHESLAADHAIAENTNSELFSPNAAEFWASDANRSRHVARENVTEGSAPGEVRGDGTLRQDGNAAPEKACSELGNPSTDLKRKAENDSETGEKKQKLNLPPGFNNEQTLDSMEEDAEQLQQQDVPQEALGNTEAELVVDNGQPEVGKQFPDVIRRPEASRSITSPEIEDQSGDDRPTAPEESIAHQDGDMGSKTQELAVDPPQVLSLQSKAGSIVTTRETRASRSRKSKKDEDEDYKDEDDESVDAAPGVDGEAESVVHVSTKPKATIRISSGKTAPDKPAKSNKSTPRQETPVREKDFAPPSGVAAEVGEVSRSSAPELPKIAPTRQRANPAEMAVLCDKTYVEKQMGHIERMITTTMLALFQEKQFDLDALPKIESRPEPELEDLYEAQWGKNWQVKMTDLLGRKTKPGFLRQKTTFMGLLGTSIRLTVFNAPLPWDVGSRLESDSKYFEQVFNDLGHDMGEVLNYVKSRQIADPEFRKRVVVPLARRLAGSLALTLSAHIKRIMKGKKIPDSQRVNYDPWISYLEEAFENAIVLKQTLLSSKMGQFGLLWPLFGQSVDKDTHRMYFELRGGALADAKVMHAILPGVHLRTGGKKEVYSQALVVAE